MLLLSTPQGDRVLILEFNVKVFNCQIAQNPQNDATPNRPCGDLDDLPVRHLSGLTEFKFGRKQNTFAFENTVSKSLNQLLTCTLSHLVCR